ncbi:TolC family protein [Autumnicola edwardsiae]|uniref:TolC family protein n=1 Tax=Autumnicola edwardsiae TaxID=3075594 RepID=A0ABU3CQE5_9FLAO|nr:TolC family protein [Zunongwangia sp. F297]MDT0648573.1 TolC family protein [Zunongwangia sp. F297]
MNKKIIQIFLLLFCSNSFLNAQEQDSLTEYNFTLQEAVEYGLENAYRSIIAQKEIEKTLKQKWEIISEGLPQISGEANYTYNLVQPVTLIPAELSGGAPGTFVPVTFGTEQNMAANATWNQLLFDGSYIVGIQSAKTLLQISENQKVKTDLEVKKAITDAYGNVLLARQSTTIARKNVETIEQNLSETRIIYENGLSELEDVEQLEITLLNQRSNLNNSIRMLEIAYDMLKLSMGIPIEDKIYASDNLEKVSEDNFPLLVISENYNIENNIDYRIAEDQTNLAEVEVKLEKSKALPTLTAFVNYGVQGYSDAFTFFNDNQTYFDQSILGVNLSVPIFSSGKRSARTAQKEIALEQAQLEKEQTRNEVKMEIERARNEYIYAIEDHQNKEQALELAERIENKNEIKFFEGLATSFELSEARQQLFQSQQQYLQSMLDLLTAKTDLETLLDTTRYEEIQNN